MQYAKESTHQPDWYKLDNVAKMYSATTTRNWNSVFRVHMTLGFDIQPELLSAAVKDICPRFPTFFVQLRKGFFWYFFETANDSDIVQPETEYPCRPIRIAEGVKPLFRVLYYKSRISLEVFHSVTDGTGAFEFLKTLVCRYLELCGYDVSAAYESGILNFRDMPTDTETEDSFAKYYTKTKGKSEKKPNAFRFKSRKSMDENYLRVISGTFSVEDLKKISRQKGATITQYLTALYILSFGNCTCPRTAKPVTIFVPANLRKTFPSSTLRNFSLFTQASAAVNPDTTLDEVLTTIIPQFSDGLEKDKLLEKISANVGIEKNFAVRIVPLFIKNFLISIINSLAERKLTSSFSNIGVVTLPDVLSKHVKKVGFMFGGSTEKGLGIGMTASSYQDKITVTFSSQYPNASVQSFFFSYLAKQGISVEVETNV